MVPCRLEFVVQKTLCLVALLAAFPLHAQESRADQRVGPRTAGGRTGP